QRLLGSTHQEHATAILMDDDSAHADNRTFRELATRQRYSGGVSGGGPPGRRAGGLGNTTRLRWPFALTARTPKKKLSLEMLVLYFSSAPAVSVCSQRGAVVSRHTTS